MKASKTREASNDKRIEDADGRVERVRSTWDMDTMLDGRRRSIMVSKSLDGEDVEEKWTMATTRRGRNSDVVSNKTSLLSIRLRRSPLPHACVHSFFGCHAWTGINPEFTLHSVSYLPKMLSPDAIPDHE
jgi:hypothetical protein